MNKPNSEKKSGKSSSYLTSKNNATRHGILSKRLVLPWENAPEYDQLIEDYKDDFKPVGRPETRFVEILAQVDWRSRRVLVAEYEAHKKLSDKLIDTVRTGFIGSSLQEVVGGSFDRADLPSKRVMIRINDIPIILIGCNTVRESLEIGGDDAYERAVDKLDPRIRSLWEDLLSLSVDLGSQTYRANSDDLVRFLDENVVPWLEFEDIQTKEDVEKAQQRHQFDLEACERFARYETHFDRKYERTLLMLLKLQERRKALEP